MTSLKLSPWLRGASHDATVKEIIWTQGAHDIVTIVDAPDGETASIINLSAAKLGNIRGQTMRAEMEKILAKVE
jgi:uncharacterized protein with GYD domain